MAPAIRTAHPITSMDLLAFSGNSSSDNSSSDNSSFTFGTVRPLRFSARTFLRVRTFLNNYFSARDFLPIDDACRQFLELWRKLSMRICQHRVMIRVHRRLQIAQ